MLFFRFFRQLHGIYIDYKITSMVYSYIIGNQCRFYPTCSHYTQEAIQKHGLAKGVRLGAGRILRCHPWHPGGIDLVPDSDTPNNPSTSSLL